MKYITAALFGILLIAHCGDRGEEIVFEDTQAVPVDTLSITSRLAIGAEEFDTEYCFAEVASICHAPDSSLLVVDPRMANVRRFSPTGELMMQYGSRGQGPGELTEPWDVAVSSGGFVFVSDLRGLNVYTLDSGEWIVLDYRYTRPILLRLLGNRDSTFTALHYSIDISEEQPLRLASYNLYRWTSPTEVSFWEDTSVADHSNSEYTRLCYYQPIVAADADGNVYISGSTPSRLFIRKYSHDGNLLLTIDEEIEPVPLSEEEKQREVEYFEFFTSQLGMSIDYTPRDEWRSVTDLGVDGQERIWARVGGAEPPLYRIYDQSGDMVCFIRIEDIPVQGWYLDVRISPWGIAAFPFDPAVEHIQVFLLESPDWESL